MLYCIIRNFILVQANLRGTFDHATGMVALPCIVQTQSDNPSNLMHLHCLCNYELSKKEREELELDDKVNKGINE